MHDIQNKLRTDMAPSSAGQGLASVTELPGRAELDAKLMQRIHGRSDKNALQEIALHYGPRLKSFLMYRGEQPQTAEDMVQEVLILVWTKSEQFDPQKGSFSAWVYRMTRNKWIDHKRKYGRLQSTAPDLMAILSDDEVDAADVHFDREEAASSVRKSLALLSNDQKQILQLSFFEGLSHNQIAERTGLPLGTVKGRIRASLKKMQPSLENFRGVDQ